MARLTYSAIAVGLITPAAAFVARPPLTRAARFNAPTVNLCATPPQHSFASLAELDKRLHVMQSKGVTRLASFYDPNKNCFALTAGRERYSVTSTVFALLAVDAAPAEWKMGCPALTEPARLKASLSALLEAEWRENDVFQSVLVTTSLRVLDPDASSICESPATRARFAAALGTVLSCRPLRRKGRNQPLSAYLRFWMARAATLVLNPAGKTDPFLSPNLPTEAVPIDAAENVGLTLERTCELSYDDICRQLAFQAAGDTVTFDVIQLAYSLLTYCLVLDALGGSAAASERDADTRDAVGTGSLLPPRNERLIRYALQAIFDELDSGVWPAGQPIVLSRGYGNNVGNAFVFTPDLLASLLEVMPSHYFRPHLPKIQEHVRWLEEHVASEHLPNGAFLTGWRTNHLPPEGGPLGWCTAQAVRCISRLSTLSRELLVADVLADLGGTQAAAPDPSAWARLLDSDLPPAEGMEESGGTLKAVIEERMIGPLSSLSAADPLGRPKATSSEEMPNLSLEGAEAVASYSAILFGPPGTAKTTVVAAIAKRLGWGFVTVDTSTFLRDGLSNVAARITAVFDRLLQLENCVVLFDEIEEFVLDRSNPALTMESRMLTTAMLTKLADLRGKRRVAFFVATNRLTALDAAVTRPGRFDMQLFVGTPNLPARMCRFEHKLSQLTPSISDAEAAEATEAFEAVLSERWTSDAMFLTFLETERLAADAAQIVAARAHVTPFDDSVLPGLGDSSSQAPLKESFEAVLDAQAAVMTVRGSVRSDFLESRGLSRI